MPISIPTRHTKRMFPYEFFDELYAEYNDYVPMLPSFTKRALDIAVSDPKEEYLTDIEHYKDTLKPLSAHNLLHTELGFPVMALLPFVAKNKILDMSDPTRRIGLFVVQLFDTNHNPVFTEDLTLESCRIIPELLYDDPNLLYGILFMDTGELEVLKTPSYLVDKFLERK